MAIWSLLQLPNSAVNCAKAAVDNTPVHEHGYVSMKVYLGALKVECQRMFTSQNTVFLLIFFQSFKNVKNILNLQIVQQQTVDQAGFGLWCEVC